MTRYRNKLTGQEVVLTAAEDARFFDNRSPFEWERVEPEWRKNTGEVPADVTAATRIEAEYRDGQRQTWVPGPVNLNQSLWSQYDEPEDILRYRILPPPRPLPEFTTDEMEDRA